MSAQNISPEKQTRIAKALDAELDRQQREHGFTDKERIFYYLAAAVGEGRRHAMSETQIATLAVNFIAGLFRAREKRLRPLA